ncbi:hypothetical protein [Deinococcus sp.]|uniref:hypothetical protein n=1 Tax=Deinococcus sp. TaxID=47478 RepID=UPI003B5A12EE
MLDNILNSVRRGAERVQRRGEEVAQSARLRVEIYQLSRELDALYARLGRAYQAGSDQAVLDSVSADVRQLEEDIAARERLIAELGEAEDQADAVQAAAARTRPEGSEVQFVAESDVVPVNLSKSTELNLGDLPDAGLDAAHPVAASKAPPPAPTVAPPSAAPLGKTSPSNAPRFVEQSAVVTVASPTSAASRIWRAKEEERMSDDKVNPAGPSGENVQDDLGKELPARKDYSGVGDEAERDKMRRRPISLEEGERAERDPDPLDK